MDLTQTPSPNFTRLVQAADMEEFFLRGNKPINWRNAPWFGDGGSRWNGSSWVQDTGIKSVNYTDNYNRRREWWTLVLQSRDQLRQRMALALSEIVVVAETDLNIRSIHYGMANYWDLLAGNAFSRYRKVLGDVTQNPMMAHYLSYLKNARASGNILPDENYAREVMQLFSVGLVNRHLDGTLKLGNDGLPLPTYDQNDIREMARVFTGFGYSKLHANILAPLYPNPGYLQMGPLQDNSSFTASASLFSYYWQGPWIEPLKLFDAYHDFNAKTLFNGKTGQVALPAKTNSATESEGLADVNDALDALAGKDSPSAAYDGHPNTPVFISRLLIQRFTTSNPSAGYLYRVATTFKNTSGNLGR
ncbi:DUF1800 family protein [Verrucomicrobium spinosum]|uniref:DUF1800 family protein n=1 Tax=Verrucomicrobium spinosum TaxID=2736 RepID=UPI000B013F33|nr:DUF1800 family protein [Verrucomicrobium spinosum]